MRCNCGETYEEEEERLSEWHAFYPFFPRRVGYKDCQMFEWIERRRVYYGMFNPGMPDGYWEYRLEKS